MRDFEKKYKVRPDYLYVVDVGISESIKRRAANGGTVTFSKKEFLNDYRIKFREFYENIKHRLYIDTTNLSESEVALQYLSSLRNSCNHFSLVFKEIFNKISIKLASSPLQTAGFLFILKYFLFLYTKESLLDSLFLN